MDNPFSPGFGESPPYLAGRDRLLGEAQEQMRRGPGRSDFHRFLIGARGTGKTAAVNAITRRAVDDLGAVVLRWTAGSRPLELAIASGQRLVESALRQRWTQAAGRVDASATVGVPGVASATAQRRRSSSSEDPFGRLSELGTLAAKRRRTIIVSVDEAQLATRAEIVVIAAVMQELANIGRLPISLAIAGLPDAQGLWIDAASMLERQRFTKLGNLDESSTMAALEVPIIEAGKSIDIDALRRLTDASLGYPYAVQLMGAAAWDAAGERATIEVGAAEQGVAIGSEVLREQVFVSRWRQMSPSVREYVKVAAALEDLSTGVIVSSAVAARLGATTSALSTRRDELIRVHQVLVSDGRDQLRFSQPGFGVWVRALEGRAR